LLFDERDDVHDVWVHQRLAAGDGDIIDVAPLLEEANLVLDLVQRLVAVQLLTVATEALQVADVRHFQPADGVVVLRPRQPEDGILFERHGKTP
jgi:hypothetical protein